MSRSDRCGAALAPFTAGRDVRVPSLMALAPFILTLEKFLDYCGIEKMKCKIQNRISTASVRSALYKSSSFLAGAKQMPMLLPLLRHHQNECFLGLFSSTLLQTRTARNIPELSKSRPKSVSHVIGLRLDFLTSVSVVNLHHKHIHTREQDVYCVISLQYANQRRDRCTPPSRLSAKKYSWSDQTWANIDWRAFETSGRKMPITQLATTSTLVSRCCTS